MDFLFREYYRGGSPRIALLGVDAKQKKACLILAIMFVLIQRLTAFCYNMEVFLAYLIENLVKKLLAFKSKHAIIV